MVKKHSFTSILRIVLGAALFPLVCTAEVPAPDLLLSFDREFQMEGIIAGKLKAFSGARFPGMEKVPAGEFVEGVSGKAFIPKEDLRIEGTGVFPAPEGTISLWIKPVNYEQDWIGGPALTPGRIGRFLSGIMNEKGTSAWCHLQVRLSRHDCCSGLHWFEMWPGNHQEFRTTGPNPPFAIWQKDTWRMVTVVWFKGERRVYFNGVRIQHGTRVIHNPTIPGDVLVIPAGSKAVDEVQVWNTPLNDGQVAALFYSQVKQSGMTGAVQEIPLLPGSLDIGPTVHKDGWPDAVTSSSWVEHYSGMSSDTKPYSRVNDTLELGHRDGYLFIRYREPMADDYIPVKTLLGGHMLKRTVTGRDADIWTDDCMEVRLTGDGGKTNYILGASAGGALYDACNGDTGFTIPESGWVVRQDEDEKFWTVEMKVNLGLLSGGSVPGEWGFNVVRTVQQQGFAKRQWSSSAGNENGYGTIRLSGGNVVVPELAWSAPTGKLSVSVKGRADTPVTVSYSIKPLNFLELFPEEGTTDARYDILDMIQATGRLEKIPPVVKGEKVLPQGAVTWQGELNYVGEWAALAEVTVRSSSGKPLSRRAAIVSGSQAISTRLVNLPSRRELVVEISLASETLAGNDVAAKVTIVPEGGTKPVLSKEMKGFTGIMKEMAIGVSDVAIGRYEVEVMVEKGGSLLGRSMSKWFKSGDPKWLGNDIGVIKNVPEPWIPVKHDDGDNIAVWGRVHSFKGSFLPVSMKVLGEELLAGPMRLVITTADETIDTAAVTTPRIVTDKAGIKASITGRTVGKNLIVGVEGEMEFDGFGYFTFTLKPVDPGKPVKINSIVFEVPFKKKFAELYDDSSYSMFRTQSGRIPSEGWTLEGTDTIRVGDANRGVQFYPVFEKMGTRTTPKPLSFTPAADGMTMRCIISEGTTIESPVHNVMGFIGTPVKPYDAKRIRMTGHAAPPVTDATLKEKGCSSAQYWTAGWSNYAGGASGNEDGYYHFTADWARGLAEERKKAWEKNRQYPALYVVPGLITSRTPEYALFWKEWGGQHLEELEEYAIDLSAYEGADKRPAGRWMDVDTTRESWQDFYFYSLDKLLSAFGREGVRVGVYVDCTFHQGDPRPYRRWVQRLYQVTRKHSPDGLIIIHMSGDRKMAIWGMVDILVEGEQYTANWSAYIGDKPELTMNDCHPTVLPLDRMRATYASTLWGPQEVFLSQLWTDPRQQEDVRRKEKGDPGPSYYKRMRHSTGLMLVHDTPFWGEFYGCGVKEDPWVKRARWGYDKTVQFIPYWDSKGMFEVESPDTTNIVASAWLKPDGNLMVVLFNNTKANAVVNVKLHPEKFPVQLRKFIKAVDITSPVPAFDPKATKPDAYECKEGVLEVDMRPRDFRLLVFE